MIDRRDAAAICPIIEQCIFPGSEVHANDWRVYRALDEEADLLIIMFAS